MVSETFNQALNVLPSPWFEGKLKTHFHWIEQAQEHGISNILNKLWLDRKLK